LFFSISGGISGHAWHVDVCVLPLSDHHSGVSSWKILPAPSGIKVAGNAIQSEVEMIERLLFCFFPLLFLFLFLLLRFVWHWMRIFS
jgi:hypothetical protein